MRTAAATSRSSSVAVFSKRIAGVSWSDHSSFWRQGYPAVMLTDTAPFRYPHYHTPSDTPDKLDYARLARLTEGLQKTIESAGADVLVGAGR